MLFYGKLEFRGYGKNNNQDKAETIKFGISKWENLKRALNWKKKNEFFGKNSSLKSCIPWKNHNLDNLKFCGSLWASVSVYERLWTSANVYKRLQTFMNVCERLWTSVNVCEPRTFMKVFYCRFTNYRWERYK